MSAENYLPAEEIYKAPPPQKKSSGRKKIENPYLAQRPKKV
jgi:hypothetical protein